MEFIEHDKLKFLKVGWQKDLHIISAGPSLKGFDFNNLKSKIIMTLNNSIFHLPKFIYPSYHVYCEPVKVEIKNYIKMSQDARTKCFSTHKCSGWIQIPPFDDCQNFAFELAIKIAEKMEYKNIYLYGYDFSIKDDYVYWWGEKETNKEELDKKYIILARQKLIFNKFIEKIDSPAKIHIV
jgi:hypothetical protein